MGSVEDISHWARTAAVMTSCPERGWGGGGGKFSHNSQRLILENASHVVEEP